MLEVSNLLKSL